MNDDQDDNSTTTDDAMEATREGQDLYDLSQDKLEEDNDSPAAPADDSAGSPLPEDHPSKDSDIDPTEAYQEGEPGQD